MATTCYFGEQVPQRSYLTEEMCRAVLARPTTTVVQPDGRIRHWGFLTDLRDGSQRALRVIVLEDGQTLRNAFSTGIFRP